MRLGCGVVKICREFSVQGARFSGKVLKLWRKNRVLWFSFSCAILGKLRRRGGKLARPGGNFAATSGSPRMEMTRSYLFSLDD